MINQIDTVLYTGKTHTTGGRNGESRSDDGRLDIKLSAPGSSGSGTNPEQLFAAGWSACFIGAMKAVAGQQKISLPADLAVDAEVDLGKTKAGEFQLAVRLTVNIPGLEDRVKRELADAAHEICPYSRMTRGHVAVELKVV